MRHDPNSKSQHEAKVELILDNEAEDSLGNQIRDANERAVNSLTRKGFILILCTFHLKQTQQEATEIHFW